MQFLSASIIDSEGWGPSPCIVQPSSPMRNSRENHRWMRFIQVAFWLVSLPLLSSGFAHAKVRTVKPSGGDYSTIQACANSATAGDTCMVYAGTYNEFVTLTHSGTGTNGVCTACITYNVNPGDTVYAWGFDVYASYNVIEGLYI